MAVTRASNSLPRCSSFSAVPGSANVVRDIAHGDRALQRRREAAAGDPADLIAFAVEHQRAFANRLAAVDLEADALLRRTVLDLRENAHRAGEAAVGAAPLVDCEGEAGHDRRRLVVEVVTVERQARFEAQRIRARQARSASPVRRRPASSARLLGCESPGSKSRSRLRQCSPTG